MHLRGPMNISQLAVYQLPDEAHTMKKRTTVPFYNRRRALAQPEASISTNNAIKAAPSMTAGWLPFFKRRTYNTTTSSLPTATKSTVIVTSTVSTVTVATVCPSSSVAQPAPNTTYIGPPLPCLSTSAAPPATNPIPPVSNCTYKQQSPKPVAKLLNGRPIYVYTPPPKTNNPPPSKRQAPDWSRVAYYTSAAPAQATGLTFMANMGDPQKSGTFD
jgi:hypothetical protein